MKKTVDYEVYVKELARLNKSVNDEWSSNSRIEILNLNTFGKEVKVRVNWAGMGSVSEYEARLFAEKLIGAV